MSRSLGRLTLDLIARIAGFTGPMDKASRNAKKNTDEINKSFAGIGKAAKAALAIAGVAISASALSTYSSEWTDLNSRVRLATGSQEAALEAMERIGSAARNTYSGLKQTAEIYLGNATALTELGFSTKAQLDYTEALNNALVVGATTGQQAESVISALSKAMAIGSLQGNNLNTVIQSGGRVAQALADGMGVTTLELRKLGKEGKITGDVIFNSLTSQGIRLRGEAAAMPATMWDAGTVFGNAMMQMVGSMDGAIKGSEFLSGKIIGVADSISALASEITALTHSGQLDAWAEAASIQLVGFREDFASTLNIIAGLFKDTSYELERDSQGIGDFLIGAFVNLPANVRAYVQIVVTEWAALADKAGVYGSAIAHYLDPRNWFSDDAGPDVAGRIAVINEARSDSIDWILQERDEAIAATDAQIKKGQDLRAEYDKRGSVLDGMAAKTKGVSDGVVAALTKEQKAVQDLLKSLEDQALKLSMSESAWVAYQLAIKNATTEQINAGIAAQQKIDRITNSKAIDEETRALEQQILKLSMSTQAWTVLTMTMQGALPHQIAYRLNLLDMVDDLERSAERTKRFEQIQTGMWERLGEAGAGVFTSIMNDADNAFSGILELFKTTLAEMANEALVKPIVFSFQESFTGGGGVSGGGQGGNNTSGLLGVAAGGWMALAGVAVVAAVSSWNAKQDEKFAKMEAAYRQGTQSTGTLLGQANAKSESIAGAIGKLGETSNDILSANQGMYLALVDIRAGIAGVASGFARTGLGANGIDVRTGTSAFVDHASFSPVRATGDALLKFANSIGEKGAALGLQIMAGLGDKITKELFKQKVSVSDSGIEFFGQSLRILLSGGMIDAMSYVDITKEKKVLGISLGKKLNTQFEELDALFASQLTGVFVNSADVLRLASETFEIDFDAYLDRLLIDPQKLSLKDLEGDALTAEIEAFFSSTLDGWASVLLAGTDVLAKYQQVGEGAFETMVRLGSQTEHFVQQLMFVGLELGATGLAAVTAVQDIAGLAGGFEALSGSMSFYYDKFFTDTEKFANLSSQLTDATAGILDALPATTTEFRAIIDALDLTTEAGQQSFAALMNLTPAIYQYIAGLDEQAKAAESAAAAQAAALAEAEQAGKALADFMQPFIDKVADFGLGEFERSLLSLNRSLDESIRQALELGASEQQLSAIRAAADIDMLGLLTGQTDAALTQFANGVARQIEALNTDAQVRISTLRSDHDARIASLNGWLDTQLSHYERRASALSSSIATLTGLSDSLARAADALAPISTVSQQMGYNQALLALGGITSGVQAGGALPTAELIESLTAALSGGGRYYSSFEDYAVATAGVLANIDALSGVTEKQLTTDEKLLAAVELGEKTSRENHQRMLSRMQTDLDAQINVINEQNRLAVESLEAQRADMEAQISALRGIDMSVLSVEEALQGLRDAMQREARQREQVEAQLNGNLMDQLGLVSRNTGDLVDEFNRLRLYLEGAA